MLSSQVLEKLADEKTIANQKSQIANVTDFVSEDDVKSAIAKGEKIWINEKTIITPSARDLGDANEIFANV